MIINPKEINYSKFKRVFAFGCSFTFDKWPTWADILRQEMLDAEFYNFGKSGAGNLMISSRIVEADKRFNFTDTDLILVMWSTFCREDRWLHGSWLHPGNIFTQNIYDKKFVEKFSDPLGYLIRDVSLISLSLNYLEKTPATAIAMPSVPLDHQIDDKNKNYNTVIELYKSQFDSMPVSMFEDMGSMWDPGHTYFLNHSQSIFQDYHPNPIRYFNYLKNIGFPLSYFSEMYAKNVTEELLQTSTENEIAEIFSYLKNFDANSKLF